MGMLPCFRGDICSMSPQGKRQGITYQSYGGRLQSVLNTCEYTVDIIDSGAALCYCRIYVRYMYQVWSEMGHLI